MTKYCDCTECPAHTGSKCGNALGDDDLRSRRCSSCKHACACPADCRHHSNLSCCPLQCDQDAPQRVASNGDMKNICKKCQARFCKCTNCPPHAGFLCGNRRDTTSEQPALCRRCNTPRALRPNIADIERWCLGHPCGWCWPEASEDISKWLAFKGSLSPSQRTMYDR